jgi:hypothetical protein
MAHPEGAQNDDFLPAGCNASFARDRACAAGLFFYSSNTAGNRSATHPSPKNQQYKGIQIVRGYNDG